MALPPLPPGFQLDGPRAQPNMADTLGRPVVVPGPKSPTPQTPAQALNDQLQNQKLQLELAKKDNSARFRDPKDEILGVLDAAGQAARTARKGLAATPAGRALTGWVPGTEAKDLSGYLDTIRANTAFKQLQQMRQDSPTGGAVGNVSDADMKLLGSTIASLDPTQSNEKFTRDLHKVIQSYGKVLMKLPGGKDEFTSWRKNFLGFDPNNQQQLKSATQQGGIGNLTKGADGVLEWHP